MDRIIIGIDIAKKKFDVAYKSTNQKWHHSTFDNTIKGYKSFIAWVSNGQTTLLHGVMEATGRYGEDLANFLYAQGYQVSVVNPAQIKYYSRSLLKRSKTDKVDSRLIAEFAERHELILWKPLALSLQALKEYVRCADAFKKDATQISNRLEAVKDLMVRQMLEERLAHIQQQIKALECEIKELAKKDEELEAAIRLLVSIPGIGEKTAWNLLSELPALDTFKCAKQLAAYAGLNPSIRQSGASIRGKGSLSRVGNPLLRKYLFLPAMSLMRCQSALTPFIARLKGRGKKGMVVVGAVMHKLIHIIFGVLKKRVAFQG